MAGHHISKASRSTGPLGEGCLYPDSCDYNYGAPCMIACRLFSPVTLIKLLNVQNLLHKSFFVAVNNVGVMYDYPQLFLDVPFEVNTYSML